MNGPNVAGVLRPTADTYVVVHQGQVGIHGVYGTFDDWGMAQAWMQALPVPMRHSCVIKSLKGIS